LRCDVSGGFYGFVMIIDCDSCVMREIACKDCVVSVFISSPRNLDDENAGVIDLLASRGMVPPLRYAQRAGFEDNSQESQAVSG
jgi:hypothetical protein